MFIKLTRLDDNAAVYVFCGPPMSIGPVDDGGSIIAMPSSYLTVKETPEEIMALIEAKSPPSAAKVARAFWDSP